MVKSVSVWNGAVYVHTLATGWGSWRAKSFFRIKKTRKGFRVEEVVKYFSGNKYRTVEAITAKTVDEVISHLCERVPAMKDEAEELREAIFSIYQ